MKELLPVFSMVNEKNFPVNVHYHKGEFKEHLHSHWEIVINIDGESTHNIIDKSYVLSKNQVILIKPSDKHSISDKSVKKHTSLSFEVSKNFISAYCNLINDSLYQKLLDSPNIITKLSKSIIDGIVNYLSSTSIKNGRMGNQDNQSNIRNIVCLLLSHLILKQYAKPNVLNMDLHETIPIVSQFLNLIQSEENIKSSFSEICGQLHYSKGHIIRSFKQNNMETPNKIFVRYKLSYACKLLDTTNLSVDSICEEIGFSSYSYFNKIFQKEYNMSPAEFRRRIIKN